MVDARDLEKGAVEVSVTVCTYNRETLLRLTLLSLAGQRCCSFQYEIVVVDDGSTDGTPLAVSEIASGTKAVIRYFREERVGVAAARNRAVLESRGRWIAFIDDDETADENWLSELMSCAAATGADCVGGSLTLQPLGGAGFLSPTTRKTLGEARPQPWFQKWFGYPGPGTGNALVRREVFEVVGLFDDTLEGRGEDQDFFRRARRAGYKTSFTPNAKGIHFIPEERLKPPYFLAIARENGRSIAYFDCRDLGPGGIALRCALRVLHVGYKASVLPFRCVVSQAIGSEILGFRCSLSASLGYLRQVWNCAMRRHGEGKSEGR